MTIALSARRTLAVMLAVGVVLAAASLAYYAAAAAGLPTRGIAGIVDINYERAVANWWSVLGLAFAAALLAAAAERERRAGAVFWPHWALLAAGFAMMSVDELVGLHDRVGKLVHACATLHGWFRFAWTAPALVLIAGLAWTYARFLRALPARRRRSFLMAATLYLGGSVGLEMLGGRIFDAAGERTWPYILCFHAEEFLEMAGVAFFVCALLEHLGEALPDSSLILRFGRGGR